MTEKIITRANLDEVLHNLVNAGHQSQADQLMKWFQNGNRNGQLPKCQYRNIDELVDLIDSHVLQSAKRKAPKHNSKRGRTPKKVADVAQPESTESKQLKTLPLEVLATIYGVDSAITFDRLIEQTNAELSIIADKLDSLKARQAELLSTKKTLEAMKQQAAWATL